MKNMKRVMKWCVVGCCTGWLLACSPAVQSVEELPAIAAYFNGKLNPATGYTLLV